METLAASVDRYFSTVETRQQLLGTWLYSGESFAAPYFPNPYGRFEWSFRVDGQ